MVDHHVLDRDQDQEDDGADDVVAADDEAAERLDDMPRGACACGIETRVKRNATTAVIFMKPHVSMLDSGMGIVVSCADDP